MTDTELYEATKRQAIEYLSGLPVDALSQRCKYCPAWSNQDVLAHHVHALHTITTGDSIPRAARDAIVEVDSDSRAVAVEDRNVWTQSGVDERRDRSLDELFEEWSEVVDIMTEEHARLVLDLSVHFDDIRESLDGPTPREGVELHRSLEFFHGLQAPRLRRAGVSSVSLAPTDAGAIGGPDNPVVVGTTYDLLRVIASRRTRQQADQLLVWEGTPMEVVKAFPVYGWPEEPGGG